MTTNIDKLFDALAKFQNECPNVPYDAEVSVRLKNGGIYKFEYATLQKVRETVAPILSKYGLAISQVFDGSNIITILGHKDGGMLQSVMPLPNREGKTNQEIGADITYFRRYSYVSILGLAADEDEDGNTVEPRVDSFQKKQGDKTKKVEKKEPALNEELPEPEYTIDMVKEKVEVKEGKTGWYIDADLSGDNPNRRLIKAAGFSYQPDKRIWVKPYPEAVIKP